MPRVREIGRIVKKEGGGRISPRQSEVGGFLQKYNDESFSHRKDAKTAERMFRFALEVRGRQSKNLDFVGKRLMKISCGGCEAGFYPAASHGRIKEKSTLCVLCDFAVNTSLNL